MEKAVAKDAKTPGTEQYSEVVTRLQGLVEALEGGGLSLEDSLEKFAEGVQLVRRGEKLLTEAEKRIEQLLSDDKVVALDVADDKKAQQAPPPAGAPAAKPAQQPQPSRSSRHEEDDVPF
jgi:exodeoxyribonuclease VII small subunit